MPRDRVEGRVEDRVEDRAGDRAEGRVEVRVEDRAEDRVEGRVEDPWRAAWRTVGLAAWPSRRMPTKPDQARVKMRPLHWDRILLGDPQNDKLESSEDANSIGTR